MAARKAEPQDKAPRRPPATTPEARENQMIALAYREAEKQILNGTASSQIINHFLKLGSSREQREQQKLAAENELLKARVENLATGKNIEALYRDATEAMTGYKGEDDDS